MPAGSEVVLLGDAEKQVAAFLASSFRASAANRAGDCPALFLGLTTLLIRQGIGHVVEVCITPTAGDIITGVSHIFERQIRTI